MSLIVISSVIIASLGYYIMTSALITKYHNKNKNNKELIKMRIKKLYNKYKRL